MPKKKARSKTRPGVKLVKKNDKPLVVTITRLDELEPEAHVIVVPPPPLDPVKKRGWWQKLFDAVW